MDKDLYKRYIHKERKGLRARVSAEDVKSPVMSGILAGFARWHCLVLWDETHSAGCV